MTLTTVRSTLCLITFILAATFLIIENSCAAADEAPRVFLLEPRQLGEVKTRIRSGDATVSSAFDKLLHEAKRARASGTFSVVDKNLTPSSGDKHDFMSVAPYWWPNPNTPNGLPYVRRDGEVNPERD